MRLILGALGVLVLFLVLVLLTPLLLLAALGGASAGLSDVAGPKVWARTCVEGGAFDVDAMELPQVRDPRTGTALSEMQVWAAANILRAGEDSGVGARGQLIALMVAYQESTLGTGKDWNQPNGDGDAGYFQQRVKPGWYGTLDEVNDPYIGARKFFDGVLITKDNFADGGAGPIGYRIPGLTTNTQWASLPYDAAAHYAQRSAYPKAILNHEGLARAILDAFSGKKLPGPRGACPQEDLPVQVVDGVPSEESIAFGSSKVACPDGTVDLGIKDGGYRGQHVSVRICEVPNTVCTGTACSRGHVMANSVVAPYFIDWLQAVRKAGYSPTFSSTFRTWAQQPTGPNAASKGWSHHQLGAAFDINGLIGADGTGWYSKKNCPGKSADGGCYSLSEEWPTYNKLALERGGAFLDSEFWHLEWVISNRSSRNLPF